jgi:hypothetical protein
MAESAAYDEATTMPPVVSLQRDLCFVEVIEGETDYLERQRCESDLVDRLSISGVSLQSVDINAAGCFVLVKCEDVDRLKGVARAFNVAIRIHELCGRISLRSPDRGALPSLSGVISALHRKSVRIVQIVSDAAELAVIVDTRQIPAALAILKAFSLEREPKCVALTGP